MHFAFASYIFRSVLIAPPPPYSRREYGARFLLTPHFFIYIQSAGGAKARASGLSSKKLAGASAENSSD
jgi:hypothetical protein